MSGRAWLLFVVRTFGFAVVTAAGGWLAVPASAAFWALLAGDERRRELSLAFAASAGWALLLYWTLHGVPAQRLLGLLGGIFRVPGWTLIVLTLAIPFLLAWSAAVVAGEFHRSRGRLLLKR